LGISPGVEVYNQFFEHYARTHNYRMAKTVLRIMGSAKPSVKPDAVTYGYLISCFSESKKPRSSLAIFHQMRKRGIPADAYTYMGVLKALSLMRDGLSALQVISEMRDNGVKPDKRHYSMAMFACITANQCTLAESLYTSFLRYGERPDAALYTLYLRALLQQGKWDEGNALLARMLAGKERARPNSQTLNYVLQYQVLAGRFEEASETFKLLLSDSASGSGSSAAQPPTHLQVYSYQALSLALGHYSSVAQRMQRDEQSFAARLGANSRLAMDLVGMASDGDASEQFNRDANFFSSDRMLATPSPEALRFLVSCIESVGNIQQFVQVSCLQTCIAFFSLILSFSIPLTPFFPSSSSFLINSWVQGELFLEVLRALVLENQPVLAKRLLDLRESGGVRLRDEELDAAAPIIELARRALKAWSKSAQVNP
jgi:pentatricopeptide repeat protein